MTKRKILWLAIIFIIYEVLVWGFSLVVLSESNSLLIGSVLTICGLTLLGVYILVARLSARAAGPPAAVPPPVPPQGPQPIPAVAPATREETDALAGLIAEANARLAQSPRLASQRARSTITDFPVYLMFGSDGSGKTSLFLASGLDLELLAGQVQRDSTVVPTRLANIWFAGNSVVVEAGGQLFSGDPGRWGRFLELFGPPRAKSSVSKMFSAPGRSNVRAAVLCVDASAFIGIPDSGRQAAMVQRAQQHLRKIAEMLGADFPVYVVFTKADNIKYFSDYFGRLTEAEDQQIFGCTLAPVPPAQFGSSDQYTAAESARITTALNNLYVSLADKRLRCLERESDKTHKPAVYEFPREVRRIRAPLVQFLVDVFRPNPLQPNPSLRGFYFTGTRKVAVAGSSDQSITSLTGLHKVGEVTRIFRPGDFQTQTFSPQGGGGGGEQLITRWAFTTELWRSLLRSGQAALAPVAVNRRQENLRKMLFASVAAACLLIFLLFVTSWFRNRSLLGDVQTAAAACEPLPAHTMPSLKYLQGIDHLRDELGILVDYDETHPPLFMRWGLYSGDRVLDAARHQYFTRFREYFLKDVVQRLETGLSGLPVAQTDAHPYQEVFGDLKIYRTITKSSEKACPTDGALVEELMKRWRGERTLDAESEKIAHANFEFYVESLKRKEVPEDLLLDSKDPAVKRGREYLTAYTGIEPLYHRIIAQANQEVPNKARLADFTTKYKSTLRVADQVDAAFTKDGWVKVQQLIDTMAQGSGSDSCVLGTGGGMASKAASFLQGSDPKRQLREMYIKDYVRRWSEFIGRASTLLPYTNCGDAEKKLDILKETDSPILAVLLMIAENTTFPKAKTSFTDEARQEVTSRAKSSFRNRLPFGLGNSKAAQQRVDQAAPENAPALTEDYITQTFQSARAVFEQPNRSRWNDKRNDPYLDALRDQQRAMQTLNRNGKCDDDPKAIGDANTQMLKSLDAVTALSRNFDNVGVYDSVKAFLTSPIQGVKPLIDIGDVSKRKLNGAQGALCSKVNPLKGKKPFSPQASDEVSLDQVTDVFSPQAGALGALRQALGDQVVKSGSTWTEKPDATLKLSRPFMAFFNQISAISDALFPPQGAKPSMHYKLLVKPNPGVKQVKGILDGDVFSMTEKQYNWPAPKPGIDLRVEQSSGGDSALRGYPGNWGIFQMLSSADRKMPPNQFGLVYLQGGSGSLKQNILPDGTPIVLEVVEFPNGVQRAFDTDFFRLAACPAKATED